MGRVADAGGQVTVVTATRGENGTDDPRDRGRIHFGHQRELDEAEIDRKRRALARHGSQTAGLAAAMGETAHRT